MLILGIDPGLSGAMALYDPEGGLLTVEDIPTLELLKAGKKRRTYDPYEIARWIDVMSPQIGLVMVEQVCAMPSRGVGGEVRGMGAQSSFAFGEVFGFLKGVCTAHFLRVETVVPQTWRRAMGVKGGKDESRARASVLMPRSAETWRLKKHDGRAEAALIAMYGARLHATEAA